MLFSQMFTRHRPRKIDLDQTARTVDATDKSQPRIDFVDPARALANLSAGRVCL
jgi:hypothetical protein